MSKKKNFNEVKLAAEVDNQTCAPTDRKASGADIHAGHRSRLRARCTATELENVPPHEVMEMLLTYCIQRKDVNALAHALIDRFGSLAGVLDAEKEELCSIPGIGEGTASFLSLLPDLFRLYEKDKKPPADRMDSLDKVINYLHTLYIGATQEKVYLLLFDNALRLIDCSCVGEGTVNCAQVPIRTIVERVVNKHAASVILAHNHPNGLAFPSEEDKAFTDAMVCALDMIEVPLLEHVVVTDTLCMPILRRRRTGLRAVPINVESGLDDSFWQNFYSDTKGMEEAL